MTAPAPTVTRRDVLAAAAAPVVAPVASGATGGARRPVPLVYLGPEGYLGAPVGIWSGPDPVDYSAPDAGGGGGGEDALRELAAYPTRRLGSVRTALTRPGSRRRSRRHEVTLRPAEIERLERECGVGEEWCRQWIECLLRHRYGHCDCRIDWDGGADW